jgi:argininosuccinate lyase
VLVKSRVTERLKEGPAPEVLEHLYGPRLQEEFAATFPYMTAVNKVHVLMLARQKIIDQVPAGEILQALLTIERHGPQAFHLDPGLEDAFFNYEAAVIRLTGSDVGGQMHTARSRNDLGATLIRLQLRDAVLEFLPLLLQARSTALEQAERYADVVMPGYTHLQPAQPVTFGHYLAGVAAALERDTHRIAAVYVRLNQSPLGAGALAGTTFPIDRQYTSDLLGFDSLVEHTLDAVASRDFVLELLAQWAIFGLTCSRLAQDFYVWFTHEFRMVDFPDRVAGTSSIMPQKKNPVVLEHLKGKPAHLLAGFMGAASAVKNTPFTNTIDGNREATHGLWQALTEARRCAILLRLVLATVTPNASLMLERAQVDFCTATDLADSLVRHGGLSFRQAHHVVGGVVREALERGLRADQISVTLVDEIAQHVVGHAAHLSEAAVQHALDANRAIHGRTPTGGPAPSEVRRMVQEARQRLAAEAQAQEARQARVSRARRRLATAMRTFLRQGR